MKTDNFIKFIDQLNETNNNLSYLIVNTSMNSKDFQRYIIIYSFIVIVIFESFKMSNNNYIFIKINTIKYFLLVANILKSYYFHL